MFQVLLLLFCQHSDLCYAYTVLLNANVLLESGWYPNEPRSFNGSHAARICCLLSPVHLRSPEYADGAALWVSVRTTLALCLTTTFKKPSPSAALCTFK